MSVPLRCGLVAALLFLLLPSGALAGSDSVGDALYDVDFAAPLHTVGSAPTTAATGVPRATPTAIRRNPVLVSAAYGDLTDQPMAFPGPTRGEVDFSLQGLPLCPSYRLTLRVVVDSDLRIFLYSPFVNLVHFRPDGDVAITAHDMPTGSQATTVVGSYTPGDGTAHDLELHIDLEDDVLALIVDGVTLHVSDFGGQTDLTLLRLAGTLAGVDDLILESGEEEARVHEVPMLVKPGSTGVSPINIRSRGSLPVALLGSDEVPAATVDVDTLTLSGTETEASVRPHRSSLEDVDDDGVEDILLHFSTPALVERGVLTPKTEVLILEGATHEDAMVRGTHAVRVLAPARR